MMACEYVIYFLVLMRGTPGHRGQDKLFQCVILPRHAENSP